MEYNNTSVCSFYDFPIFIRSNSDRHYLCFKRYEVRVDSFYRHCSIIENTRAEVIDPFRGNAKGNEFMGNA